MNQRGFTLKELFIAFWILVVFLAVLVSACVAFYVVPTMNVWFTEPGVLRAIQVDHPEASRILITERNIRNQSRIVVENNDGTRSVYLLDTSILYNYDLKLSE